MDLLNIVPIFESIGARRRVTEKSKAQLHGPQKSFFFFLLPFTLDHHLKKTLGRELVWEGGRNELPAGFKMSATEAKTLVKEISF